MIDVTAIPARQKDMLRSVQTARGLGLPGLDSPAVKLARAPLRPPRKTGQPSKLDRSSRLLARFVGGA